MNNWSIKTYFDCPKEQTVEDENLSLSTVLSQSSELLSFLSPQIYHNKYMGATFILLQFVDGEGATYGSHKRATFKGA